MNPFADDPDGQQWDEMVARMGTTHAAKMAMDAAKAAGRGESLRYFEKNNGQQTMEQLRNAEYEASRETSSKMVRICDHCGQSGDLKCAKCQSTFYCSSECQRLSWGMHKATCGILTTAAGGK